MGIPFYFASLLRSHAGIVRTIKRINVDILAVDFNCFIHRYLKDEDPYQSIISAFEYLIQNICFAGEIVIALDGLVPYAKIVNQRYRRMRHKSELGIFDRNQISPGTPYMKELEKLLKAKFPCIRISTTNEAGEGEHKLFNAIDTTFKSVCVYGLDADLILICLKNAPKTNSLVLLRESTEFNDPSLKDAEFSILNVNLLLEQIPLEINQYIALSIMCFGNDFMPNLGIFSLREGGYERALEFYRESGNPDILTFEGRTAFLEYAGERELGIFKDIISKRKRPEEKAIFGKDGSNFSRRYGIHVLDGVINMQPVVDAYWKTFHWTLFYFMNGYTNNWEWYYPYADAPLITDILQYDESGLPKPKELNYTIKNQLQFILPSVSLRESKRLKAFKDEIYHETRNPWMKRNDWEMKPRISLPWHPTNELTSVSLLAIQF
jgi:5'-3' exonuclease